VLWFSENWLEKGIQLVSGTGCLSTSLFYRIQTILAVIAPVTERAFSPPAVHIFSLFSSSKDGNGSRYVYLATSTARITSLPQLLLIAYSGW